MMFIYLIKKFCLKFLNDLFPSSFINKKWLFREKLNTIFIVMINILLYKIYDHILNNYLKQILSYFLYELKKFKIIIFYIA